MMDSVLIVEDHDRLREQLGRFYAEEGYKVVTAACGEEAIEKLTKEKFAIVVSDVKMPGIDGFQHSFATGKRSLYCGTGGFCRGLWHVCYAYNLGNLAL